MGHSKNLTKKQSLPSLFVLNSDKQIRFNSKRVFMKTVTIVGAGGNVGSALAQWLARRSLAQLVLVDLQPERAAARFEDYLQSSVYDGDASSFKSVSDVLEAPNSDVVIVTAGLPRKPGQSREDLVSQNAQIVSQISSNVAKSSPHSILIIVSNPLDAMTQVALQASGFPAQRVIGSAGCLDSARFQYQIAKHLKTGLSGIEGVVLGAHTDTDMVPLVSQARLNGVPLTSLTDFETIESIVEETKKGGASLTQRIGTSAWLAPGAATGIMVEAILKNSRRMLPCSVQSQGCYGLKEDLFIGLPTQLGSSGVEKVCEIPITEEEKSLLFKSAEAIQQLCKAL
jgi:malate dehydrogenase